MRQLGTISLIVCLAAASGCNICCWGKRATELTGPTDIRRSHYWCFGEDAVFAQPMGPSRNDYGLKPTCWREWPTDGARCLDDSCGPMLGPEDRFYEHGLAPPTEQAAPGGFNQEGNPFLDDSKLLPAPLGTGAQRRGIVPGEHVQSARPNAKGPGRPVQLHSNREAVESIVPITRAGATNAMQGPELSPLPRPSNLVSSPSFEQSSEPKPPLKITVSAPIDTPVQFLDPAESPRGATVPAVATSEGPAVHEATLASLEKMIDTAPVELPAATSPGAKVFLNDFAPAPQPFRLATRDTRAAPESDEVLQSKTLSALESMMSADARER